MAQNFTSKWNSPSIPYATYAAWLDFEKVGDKWKSRLYAIDSNKIQIMSDGLNYTPQYTYNFTAGEKLADRQIYSLEVDLTGDNIVEFYVLSWAGTTTNYRQSFKIFDITTGNTLFEKNDAYYYSYPILWDMDADGNLECLVTKFVYPSFTTYTFEVYNTGISGINDNGSPVGSFSLKQNFPNPFNPSTTISFELKSPDNVRIEIFDVRGSLIKTLFSGNLEPGSHQLEWDGKAQSGARCPSGVYFYNLSGSNSSESRKMVMLK
ncbi:MAG: T9SS type A sorting domain-containing protein [Ignavibacteriaceae bacterium]|nr:T9SS type A sorting domain-containing protein [Ignavibacteriaceae bacterium]